MDRQGNPLEEEEEGLYKPGGLKTPWEHDTRNQLSRACGDSERLKWQTRTLHGSEWGLPFLHYSSVAWCSYRTPNNGSGGVSGSFDCFWGPFPPTVLPHLALIWRFVSSLVRPCSVGVLGRPALLFLWFVGERRWGARTGGVKGRETEFGMWCMREEDKKQKEHRKTMGSVWLWPISLKWSLPGLPEKVCLLFLLPPTSCLLSWNHKRLSYL